MAHPTSYLHPLALFTSSTSFQEYPLFSKFPLLLKPTEGASYFAALISSLQFSQLLRLLTLPFSAFDISSPEFSHVSPYYIVTSALTVKLRVERVERVERPPQYPSPLAPALLHITLLNTVSFAHFFHPRSHSEHYVFHACIQTSARSYRVSLSDAVFLFLR